MAASSARTPKRTVERAGVDVREGTRDDPPSASRADRESAPWHFANALVPVVDATRVGTDDALGFAVERAMMLEAMSADISAGVTGMCGRCRWPCPSSCVTAAARIIVVSFSSRFSN
tara:strand:+ start:235 stop:585 length:351 start_codon:yes stop_codon:yes gene_type:complete